MSARTSPLLNTATTLGKIVAFFVASAVAGLLVAGTMVPLAVGASTLTTVAGDAYDAVEVPTDNAPIAQPSVLEDRDGNVIAKFFKQNRQEVKLKNVSKAMQHAIVDIEDERFYEHGGVDARGILRALVTNVTGTGRQGASTITQQYVANLNVNNQVAAGLSENQIARNGNKDYGDKVREIKWANEVETKMSKDEILQGYLNLVPFAGATYGVEAASQRWFSKPASELNVPEAALLAGMVQRPTLYNPTTNPDAALKRRNVVLGTMLKNNDITEKQYKDAVKSKIKINPSQEDSGCSSAGNAAYFCSYVFNWISHSDAFGKTVAERQNLLYSGGLKIKSSLDPRLQKVAYKEVTNTVPVGDKGGAGASIVTRDNKTGQILAMVQNTKFGDQAKSTENPNTYTEVNFNTSSFQGGSTAKPWTAIAWLQAGHTLTETLNATRLNYSDATWKASCRPSGVAKSPGWSLGNATNGTNNVMTPSAGLFWSINSATAAEAFKLDLCDVFKVPEELGLLDGQTTTVTKTDKDGNTVYKKDKKGKYVLGTNGQKIAEKKVVPMTAELMAANPSNIIGSQVVTPLAQARAFGSFGNQGQLCQTTPFVSVTGNSGKIDLPGADCKQVIEKDIIAKLNGTLKHLAAERPGTQAGGGGQKAGAVINADIGGKTGTNNYATSTWFAGYTSDITSIVWVGRKDGKVFNKANGIYGLNSGMTVRGVARKDTDSSTYASPLWVNYMKQVYDYYPHGEIPQEGGFSKSLHGGGTSSGNTGSTTQNNNTGAASTKAATETKATESAAASSSAPATDSPKSTDASKDAKKDTASKSNSNGGNNGKKNGGNSGGKGNGQGDGKGKGNG